MFHHAGPWGRQVPPATASPRAEEPVTGLTAETSRLERRQPSHKSSSGTMAAGAQRFHFRQLLRWTLQPHAGPAATSEDLEQDLLRCQHLRPVVFEPNAGQEPMRFEAMHWAVRIILQYYTKPAVLEGLPSLCEFFLSTINKAAVQEDEDGGALGSMGLAAVLAVPQSVARWHRAQRVLGERLLGVAAGESSREAELLLKAMASAYGRMTGELADRTELPPEVVCSILNAVTMAFQCSFATPELVLKATRMVEALAAGQTLEGMPLDTITRHILERVTDDVYSPTVAAAALHAVEALVYHQYILVNRDMASQVLHTSFALLKRPTENTNVTAAALGLVGGLLRGAVRAERRKQSPVLDLGTLIENPLIVINFLLDDVLRRPLCYHGLVASGPTALVLTPTVVSLLRAMARKYPGHTASAFVAMCDARVFGRIGADMDEAYGARVLGLLTAVARSGALPRGDGHADFLGRLASCAMAGNAPTLIRIAAMDAVAALGLDRDAGVGEQAAVLGLVAALLPLASDHTCLALAAMAALCTFLSGSSDQKFENLLWSDASEQLSARLVDCLTGLIGVFMAGNRQAAARAVLILQRLSPLARRFMTARQAPALGEALLGAMEGLLESSYVGKLAASLGRGVEAREASRAAHRKPPLTRAELEQRAAQAEARMSHGQEPVEEDLQLYPAGNETEEEEELGRRAADLLGAIRRAVCDLLLGPEPAPHPPQAAAPPAQGGQQILHAGPAFSAFLRSLCGLPGDNNEYAQRLRDFVLTVGGRVEGRVSLELSLLRLVAASWTVVFPGVLPGAVDPDISVLWCKRTAGALGLLVVSGGQGGAESGHDQEPEDEQELNQGVADSLVRLLDLLRVFVNELPAALRPEALALVTQQDLDVHVAGCLRTAASVGGLVSLLRLYDAMGAEARPRAGAALQRAGVLRSLVESSFWAEALAQEEEEAVASLPQLLQRMGLVNFEDAAGIMVAIDSGRAELQADQQMDEDEEGEEEDEEEGGYGMQQQGGAGMETAMQDYGEQAQWVN